MSARNDKILRNRNKKKTDALQVIKDNQQLSSQSFRSIIRFLSACQNPLFTIRKLEGKIGEGRGKKKKRSGPRSGNGRRRKRSTLGGEASRVNGTSWNEITQYVCTHSTRHVDYIIDALCTNAIGRKADRRPSLWSLRGRCENLNFSFLRIVHLRF